ncbi:MAG: signal recognition particle subunit SRP19/SEC65 family protein [Candidatus Thorarchaeota archaeon]|jgi:signal recognition particle subunit SRP19|nr:signal recognition particle subunit SRP19/SEC65 family protein [Candidatus Thorarchaeota archaeon]
MRKNDGMVIVWPAYLDSKLTRTQGRRVSTNLAAPDVTIDILQKAAEMAGLEAEAATDKKYPRDWQGNSGYLLVANPDGHKKKRLLLMLAKSVRRVVARQESSRQAAAKKKGKKRKGGRK